MMVSLFLHFVFTLNLPKLNPLIILIRINMPGLPIALHNLLNDLRQLHELIRTHQNPGHNVFSISDLHLELQAESVLVDPDITVIGIYWSRHHSSLPLSFSLVFLMAPSVRSGTATAAKKAVSRWPSTTIAVSIPSTPETRNPR